MERLHIHIPKQSKETLAALAKERGISVGELIRQVVFEFIQRQKSGL
jgi:hypothetical protein